ncbi:MAG: hypothetical protein CSA22_01110 [Deltaproteobacteria bacterium]|nr:MAG: hypothetical protein CSA22_01110 [Deltaproteobacteria bacterium]
MPASLQSVVALALAGERTTYDYEKGITAAYMVRETFDVNKDGVPDEVLICPEAMVGQAHLPCLRHPLPRPVVDPGNGTAPQDPGYRDVPRLWDLWMVRVDENGNIIYDADGDPVCEPDFFDRGLLKP